MMAKRGRTYDFGFEPERSVHHFAVVATGAGAVWIDERFVWRVGHEKIATPKPKPKALLDAYHWSRICERVAEVFNQRLRQTGMKPGVWKKGETLLSPHFGKELTLLAWAVEDADATLIPAMLANWTGFAPEERWWLYTTVNATSSHPDYGKDRGWRKAIKIAFAENPTGELPPAALMTTDTKISPTQDLVAIDAVDDPDEKDGHLIKPAQQLLFR